MKTLKAVYLVTVITGLLTGLSFVIFRIRQDISGTWHGKLTVPTGSLTLVIPYQSDRRRHLHNDTRQPRPGG